MKIPKLLLAMSLAISSQTAFSAVTYEVPDYDLTTFTTAYHAMYLANAGATTGFNVFEHYDMPTSQAFVISPALDHLYSKAVLDVSVEPQLITVPRPKDKNRYLAGR